ncbi:Ig-like domain-containing protein [Pseudomonas veronii]|uniref:Ig-like domain-containing protein n=1 Tax=Pseudomonas veronii TaxID=76761 RepID=UPI0034E9779C
MQIAINSGGGGCAGVETWDPIAGRCTETEYIQNSVSVVQISPSPATVASDGTVSTLSATVRDGLGRLAPAGIEVIWAATLGNLTTTTSYTNSNGMAYAAISSQTAGASTIYAKTTVSGNASTEVNFMMQSPTITRISATASEIRSGNVSIASYVSWSGVNLNGATTYTLTVSDSRGAAGYVTGPTTFKPAKGSTGWWLNADGQKKKGVGEQDIPYFSSQVGRVTLTACNVGYCTSASTTFSAVMGDTGNGG